jgi:hypothetical protein
MMVNFIKSIYDKTLTALNISVYDTNHPDNATVRQFVVFKGVTTDIIKNRRDFILTFDLFDKSETMLNIYTWQDLLSSDFNYCNIETESVSYHSYELPGRYTVPSQNEDDKCWKHGVIRFDMKVYLK